MRKLLIIILVFFLTVPVVNAQQVGSPNFWKKLGNFILPIVSTWNAGSSTVNSYFQTTTSKGLVLVTPTSNSLLYTNSIGEATSLASSSLGTGKVLTATATAPYFSWETASGGGGSGITSLGGLTTSTQTFATTSDTNLGLSIASSGSTHTFTSLWIGQLGVARGGTGNSSTPTNGQIPIGNGSFFNITAPTQSTGISIATASGTLTFLNTGVQTLTQGTAISVSSATGTPTITNTGLQTLTAGNGLSITSATGTPTISNTGVTSLIQNTGISVTSTTGNIGIINTGVQSLTAGEDISISSATGTVTINNTAITRRVLQGTGISITTTAGSSTITNTGLQTLTQGTGISISSATGTPTITNTGVQTLTGTANQVTVSSATGTPTLSLPQNIHTGATPTFAGLTLSNFSNGGVVFASVGGLLTQSSTVFYWDNNNTRLGINTNAPSTTLDVRGNLTLSNAAKIAPLTDSVNALTISSATGTNEVFFDTTNGRVGIGGLTPSTTLHIVGTGRITGQVTLNDPTINGILYTNGSNVLTSLASSSLGTGKVLTATGTAPYFSWETASGGGGITTLNTLTAATQTFASGTTGNDFTITSSGSTHTFSIPSSSGSNRGLLAAADFTGFNTKSVHFVIENPTASEDDAFFTFNTTSTVTKVYAVNKAANDSITFNLAHSSSRSLATSSAPMVFSAYQSVTVNTSAAALTTFSSSVASAGETLRLVTTAASSSQFTVTVFFTTQ